MVQMMHEVDMCKVNWEILSIETAEYMYSTPIVMRIALELRNISRLSLLDKLLYNSREFRVARMVYYRNSTTKRNMTNLKLITYNLESINIAYN